MQVYSLLNSIPFVPESFWKLSTGAKLSRLCMVGLGVAGAAKGVSLLNRRLTDLSDQVEALLRRVELGEGEARWLRREVGLLKGEMATLKRPLDTPVVTQSLPASYAHCTNDEFDQRLQVWQGAIQPANLRAFLQSKEQCGAFVGEFLALFDGIIDRAKIEPPWVLRAVSMTRDDCKKALGETLPPCMEALAAAEAQLSDEALQVVGKTVEILFKQTLPLLFALSEGKGNSEISDLVAAYNEIPTLLPKDDSDKEWLKRIASYAKGVIGTDTLYLGAKLGLPKMMEQKGEALKEKYDEPFHACIDKTVAFALALQRITLAILHDHQGTRPGAIFWEGIVKIAKGDTDEKIGVNNLVDDEIHYLLGREGQESSLKKSVDALKAWYEQVLLVEQPSPNQLFTIGRQTLDRAFSRTR